MPSSPGEYGKSNRDKIRTYPLLSAEEVGEGQSLDFWVYLVLYREEF